jgi:hypothetical protein
MLRGSSIQFAMFITVTSTFLALPLPAQQLAKLQQLYFTTAVGAPDPLPQVVTLMSGGPDVTASVVTSSGGDWLEISRTQDSTPVSLTIKVITKASLAAGTYSGEVQVTDGQGKQVIPVTLIVAASRRLTFDRTPSQLSFTMNLQGKAEPQFMQISHVDDEKLPWSLVATTFNGADFLRVSTNSGEGPARISVAVVPKNLPDGGATPGAYTGQLLFLSGSSMVTVPVTVHVRDGSKPALRSRVATSEASTTAGATNLFPPNTQNCHCGGFNNFQTGYGSLIAAPPSDATHTDPSYGSNTGQLIFASNPESGVIEHYQAIYDSGLGSGTWTLSFHFKAAADSWAFIRSQVDGVVQRVWFNLTNGTVGTAVAIPNGWTTQNCTQNAVSGWFRCSVTFPVNQSALYNGFGLAQTDGQTGYQAPPNGMSEGVYEWGQQAQSGTLTDYVPNPGPCLALSDVHDVDTTAAGNNIGFTITLTNQAAVGTGQQTTLTSTLPNAPGMNWTIKSNPGACTIATPSGVPTLSCPFGDFLPGASALVDITSPTTTASCGTYTDTATVTTSSGLSLQSNDSVNVSCPAPSAGPLTPSSGSGVSQTFSAQYTNAGGASGFTSAFILINNGFAASNACYVDYQPGTNSLYLMNDGATALLGPITPGSGATLQNSQCTLNGPTSSATVVGTTLTLNASVTFNPAFSGNKTVFIFAYTATANTGFQTGGTWTVTAGTPTAGPLSPSSGSGSAQTFTAQYTNPGGASGFTSAFILINNGFAASNACYVDYQRGTNSLYLMNDGATALLGPITPGSGATLQNSQCTLNGSTSSATIAGTMLTLNASVTFNPAFSGNKTVFIFAYTATTNTGFQTGGTWTVTTGASAPTAGPLSPSSGSGSSQTFSAQYTNPGGASGFTSAFILINNGFAASNSCYVDYQPGTNSLYLMNDGATALMGPITPGSGATLQNSQCTVNGSGSSASIVGTVLTLNVSLTFNPAFGGNKTVFIFAYTATANTGFQTGGTWTVTTGAGTPTAGPLSPSSGSGSAQTFSAQYTNPGGASGFTSAFILINNGFAASNSCYVDYQPGTNSLYLMNDGATALMGPITPGSGATLQNSQCTLNGSTSSATVVGTTLTLNASLTFNPVFAGNKTVFIFAYTATANTGFQTGGAWTVR